MKVTKSVRAVIPCRVLRDDREKEVTNRWDFRKSQYCAGTVDHHLVTGDYTLERFESFFAIERKATVNDFVGSMVRTQFKEELARLSELPHSFVILEFSMEDLCRWPDSSVYSCPEIPKKHYYIRKRLPLAHRGAAFASYFTLKLAYPYVDFIFAGTMGKMVAGNIFKRIIEAYSKEVIKNE